MSDEPYTTPQQSYISRVRLKGYKSIIDTEVELKPGLNIIIGPNGSGKTNFVEFLRYILTSNLNELLDGRGSYNYSAKIYFETNGKGIEYFWDYKLLKDKNSQKLLPFWDEVIIIDGKKDEITTRVGKYSGVILYSEWLSIYPSYIGFGIPSDFENIRNIDTLKFLTSEVDFSFEDKLVLIPFYKDFDFKPDITIGIRKLLIEMFVKRIINSLRENKPININNFIIPNDYKDNLTKFTVIENIRLADSCNFRESQKEWIISGIKFEFFVNDKWLTWNQLSDGTKRMIYIITEITFANNVVLLEEPELGIHPHQLARLMDFIKEQSETKQIILTTHSPEVLNTLGMDELDRIIVARYDKEKGTQLRHLSKEDQEFARNYMKDELFLSDYWVMSGFETEEEGA